MKTRRQCKEYLEVIPLHCYTNMLIHFAIRLMIPNCKTPDTPDFLLANKIFHNNLCIILSALLYLLHFLSLQKSLVYPPFVYILHDKCSENVTGEYSSAKYQWHNWGSTLENATYIWEIKNKIRNKLIFTVHWSFSWINRLIEPRFLKVFFTQGDFSVSW